MTKISSKHAIFNKVFFNFSFKLIAKKISVYIAIFIYCLIIVAYTIVVPILANKAPIELFTVSTSSMFLMFAMSIVSCYISIEIFRTGIDDGTELLTVSKPISRKEIIIVKLIIFLIYTLIVAILGLVIAAFTFLNKLSHYDDNVNITFGIFVGTIISGIIFGSIGTILSIYVKKISAMLITVAISFILMLISILMAFIVTTPIQYIANSRKSMISVNAVNYSKDKKSISFNQGITAYNPASGAFLDPQKIWNDAVKHSGYNYDIQFDFGYQISSLYILGSVNTDFQKVLNTLNTLNQPVDLSFGDYNLNNLSSINVSTDSGQHLMNLYLNSTGASSLTNLGSNNQNSIDAWIVYSNDDIIEMNQEITKNNGISGNVVNYWQNAWKQYGSSSSSSSSNTTDSSSGTSDSSLSPSSYFVENFFMSNNLFSDNTDQIEDYIHQFNIIQYSAFISLLYNGVKFTSTNSSNPNIYSISIDNEESRVELSLLGINIPDKITIDTSSKDSIDKQITNQIKTQNSITFVCTAPDNSSTQIVLDNPFSLENDSTMQALKTVKIEPVLQNKVIIPIWIAIAIIIFITAIILYFRSDFA